MDDYFFDEVMGSFENSLWYGDNGENTPSTYNYDPLFNHHRVSFILLNETEKAFLVKEDNNLFWIPKSLLKSYEVDGNILKGYLWNRFTPDYLKKSKNQGIIMGVPHGK